MSSTDGVELSQRKIQIGRLADLSKPELAKRDVFGRTILHLLVLTNRYDLLKRLFKNPDFKSILSATDYENGWNCMHYIVFHKKLSSFKALMEYFKTLQNNTLLYELLRCKDRSRMTPMQLLDNDFKDLMWLPEYINEKNEYHLQYRFVYDSTSTDGTAKRPSRASIRSINDWWDPSRGGSDIFVYGSNKNNNLGLGDSNDRAVPSKVPSDSFIQHDFQGEDIVQKLLSKQRYNNVIISKYHSLIVTQFGEVYSSGLGTRGRLGHGVNNCYNFKKVVFDEDVEVQVVAIASSNNHTIAFSHQNEIYGWGLNSYNQLGFTTLTSATSTSNSTGSLSSKKSLGFTEFCEPFPRRILNGELKKATTSFKGVIVSKIHSLVYTKNEIFSWGLCIGQMGITTDSTSIPGEQKINGILHKGYVQETPKRLTMRDDIKLLSTSETCMCVVTVDNDIHIYYQYQHIKLPKISQSNYNNNSQFHLFKPTILTKPVTIKKVCIKNNELLVFLLDNGDIVKLEDFKNPRYVKVWKAHNYDMIVMDFALSSIGNIILCTRNGSVFVKRGSNYTIDGSSSNNMGHNSGGIALNVRKNSMSESSLSTPIVGSGVNKFRKIDHLGKIVKVSCDDEFVSFGFIRDEIDSIPQKLHKNTFFNDLMFLEGIQEHNLYRKQNELFIADGPGNSYVKDFLYTERKKNTRERQRSLVNKYRIDEADDEDDEEESVQKTAKGEGYTDIFFQKHKERYSTKHRKMNMIDTFQNVSKLERQRMIEDLKYSTEQYLLTRLQDENSKGFDSFIILAGNGYEPSVKIGFHKFIFLERSQFCKELFQPKNTDEYFKVNDMTGRFDAVTNELIFNSHINLKSIIILIHLLYTNDVLNIWDDYPIGIHCPKDIKEIKTDFDKLVTILKLPQAYGKWCNGDSYLKSLSESINWSDLGEKSETDSYDVLVKLQDGSIWCHSPMLIARSAYFETVLSNRWDTSCDRIINFDSITKNQFEVVLKYIYGYDETKIFEGSLGQLENSPDEFINNLLDLIEIADELLLFELKLLCELGIKDLINMDNVLILLQHADFLSAKKLFMNCAWIIYNNLELLMFNQYFRELPLELLKKVEVQINFISNCKRQDFVTYGDGLISLDGEVNTKLLDDWFERNSSQLVAAFLNDTDDFNENFVQKIGRKKFEPLFDIRKDSSKKKSRSVSIEKSRTPSISDTNDRSSSFSGANSELQSGLATFRNSSIGRRPSVNNSAIDDDGEEFEQVSYNRRRKSSAPFVTAPTSMQQTKSLPDPVNVGISSIGSTLSRNSFSSERKPSLPGLSPHSNWANSASGNIKDQPLLGIESEKKTKLKVALVPRLSQKERKKKALQINDLQPSPVSSSSSTLPPWAIPSSSTTSKSPTPSPSSSLSSSYTSTNNWANSTSNVTLPVLGSGSSKAFQKQKMKKNQPRQVKSSSPSPPPVSQVSPSSSYLSSSVPPGPTLAEIMIQEALKIEEQQIRDKERKSLQEIQQEQEFDKWWSEETAKFQKLAISTSQTTNSNKKKSKKRYNSIN